MKLYCCNLVLSLRNTQFQRNIKKLPVAIVVLLLCVFKTALSAHATEAPMKILFATSSSSQSGVTTSAPPPVPSTFFGLTIMNSEVPAMLPYGTARSWDTWPHPSWANENPSRGVYNFGNLDAYIAGNAGRDMIYTLGRTPQWASSQPNAYTDYGPGQCAPPANVADWDNYITAVATHAAGKIKYWELWNEPMNAKYYCGDIPTMVVLAQHARSIIKSIDPSAMILAPSTDKAFGESWITSFLSQGGAATIDIMTIHGYPDNPPEGIVPMLSQYHALMAANGATGLPIWDTEQDGGPNSPSDLAKMYLLEWSGGVSRSLWYAYDDIGGRLLWSADTGLTPSGTAYNEVYKWLVGASLNTPCSKDSFGTFTCNLERTDYQAEAVWNSTGSATLNVLPQFVQYRDLQGGIHPIENGIITVGSSPVLIETAATDSTQLSFAAIASHTYGDVPFPVFASSASNGGVVYSVVGGPATVSGSVVTLTGPGDVVLQANQASSGNFLASSASVAFVVAPKPVPSLSLASIANPMIGSAPITVQATSNSPAPITYTVAGGPATISGTRVTFTAVGPVVIEASQPEITTFAAASTTTTFNVTPKTNPELTFPAIATHTNGSAPFSVQASSNSNGAITYEILSGPATIAGSYVTVMNAGTVVVQATQAEVRTYASATTTTSFNISAKPVPTLTMPSIAAMTAGSAAFSVQATSNSYGAITYSVVSGPATISGSYVTVTGAGNVVIQATQAEIHTYAATTATISISVSAKPLPTLTLPSIATKMNGCVPFSVKATSNSYGSVTYLVDSGPATISGNYATITGVGTVVIRATQAEIPAYAAATATTSFSVIAKTVAALSIAPIDTKATTAAPFPIATTSNSNGVIAYSIASGPATISGSYVTVKGIGTVVVQATQAEASTFAAATATTSFNVIEKLAPELTLSPVGMQSSDVAPFPVTASSKSNSPITYSIVSGPATISGSLVTIKGIGAVVVKATQPETAVYNAATFAIAFDVVTRSMPTLTLPAIATKTNGASAFAVKASSNSYGAVTYSIASGPATISGYMVTVNGVGKVVVQAHQAEVTTYTAATVTTSFSVLAKPIPALAMTSIATQTNGAGAFAVKASSNSYGAVTYSIVSGPAAISGYMVTLNGAGTVVIQASQAEVATYAAATATTTFNVLPKPIPTLAFPSISAQTYGASALYLKASSKETLHKFSVHSLIG